MGNMNISQKERDILESIDKDYQQFWQRRYNGDAVLPGNMGDKFRIAVRNTPMAQWKGNASVIKMALATKDEDLTWLLVGVIVPMLLQTPMAFWFEESEENGIDYCEKLKTVQEHWNMRVDVLNKQLAAKQKRLYDLAGLTNAVQFEQRKN